MSRLDYVTIAIVAVCVAALVYLIYMTTNLLGGEGSGPEPATAITGDDTTYEDEQTASYEGDSAAVAEDRPYEDPAYEDQDDYQGDYPGDEEGEASYEDEQRQYEEEKPEDRYQEERTPANAASEDYASVSKGHYMVLAGTFKYKTNAESMVRKLKSLGYDDARTELFDRGAFAVALVGHYPDYDDAKRISGELKNKGVDAYVKKK